MQQLFAALHGSQEATNRFYSAITGSTPLPAFMNPENIDRIVAKVLGIEREAALVCDWRRHVGLGPLQPPSRRTQPVRHLVTARRFGSRRFAQQAAVHED